MSSKASFRDFGPTKDYRPGKKRKAWEAPRFGEKSGGPMSSPVSNGRGGAAPAAKDSGHTLGTEAASTVANPTKDQDRPGPDCGKPPRESGGESDLGSSRTV